LIVLSGVILAAQTRNDAVNNRPVDNLNLTFLGNASLISFNYERLFFIKPASFLAFDLGLGYNEEFQICIFGPCPPTLKYFTLPHYVTGNIGKRRHFFEFGLGGTVIVGNTAQHYLLYPIAGYRLQPLKSDRMYFRVFGQIPFVGLETIDVIFVPVGFSIGASF
ncbi:MAG: hypothetical protein IH595_10690, partial [Bacteroidales bacterium]|nr:hypothetical protein [Bacteroidales bacterium]